MNQDYEFHYGVEESMDLYRAMVEEELNISDVPIDTELLDELRYDLYKGVDTRYTPQISKQKFNLNLG